MGSSNLTDKQTVCNNWVGDNNNTNFVVTYWTLDKKWKIFKIYSNQLLIFGVRMKMKRYLIETEIWQITKFFNFGQVRRASSLLYEALEVNQYTDVWNDKKGYKCSPPILTYTSVGKENHLLDKIRFDPYFHCWHFKIFWTLSELNFKLSWKIPLQITHGDANKLRSILGGLDNLKSAMIVGSPEFGAQFYSNKVTFLLKRREISNIIFRFMLD